MTLIGVISDTHRQIPEKVLRVFEGEYDPARIVMSYSSDASLGIPSGPVDYIVHAGDIGDDESSVRKVLSTLSNIAPVYAVAGNCDQESYDLTGKLIPDEMQVFDFDGIEVACVHDPEDLKRSNAKANVFIHGHTHRFGIQEIDSRIRLCPGAIYDPRNDMGYRTVALVYADGCDIKRIDIVRL